MPATTAARAKNGTVEAGMYQFQSMDEETRYAVAAAAAPASRARLLRLLVLRKALWRPRAKHPTQKTANARNAKMPISERRLIHMLCGCRTFSKPCFWA